MPTTSHAISDACQRHRALEVHLCRDTGCHPRCGLCNGFKARRPANVRCFDLPSFHAPQHGEERLRDAEKVFRDSEN